MDGSTVRLVSHNCFESVTEWLDQELMNGVTHLVGGKTYHGI